MVLSDNEYSFRLNNYMKTKFERYLNWYVENIKISKNNLSAALFVIVVCALCLLFFPNSIEGMIFFQYSFDPTFAIQSGFYISIILALFSIFTSYRKIKSYLTIKVLLQSQYALFSARSTDISCSNHEEEFIEFVHAVDSILTANNHGDIISISQHNILNAEAQKTPKS